MRSVLVIVLTAVLGATLVPPCAGASKGLPAPDELKELFIDKKYSELILTVNRALALSGEAAKGFDRYELLTLKGEAMIQLKNSFPAQAAFAAAAKEATTREHIALAKATELLLKKSSAFAYVPKTGSAKNTPIDIMQADARKPAFEALLADELVPLQKRANALKDSTDLKAIVSLALSAAELGMLEQAASGKSEQAAAVQSQLTGQAADLIGGALDRLRGQVKKISDKALAHDIDGGGEAAEIGMGGSDRRELKMVSTRAKEIQQIATEIHTKLGESAKAMADLASKAEKLATDANRLGNFDGGED